MPRINIRPLLGRLAVVLAGVILITFVSMAALSVFADQPTRIRVQADQRLTAGYVLGGLVLAVIGLVITGLAAYRRAR